MRIVISVTATNAHNIILLLIMIIIVMLLLLLLLLLLKVITILLLLIIIIIIIILIAGHDAPRVAEVVLGGDLAHEVHRLARRYEHVVICISASAY